MKMYAVGKPLFLICFRHARMNDEAVFNATSSTNEVDQATNDHDRFMLTDDGNSGFIVKKDGELIALFSTVKGRGHDLVQIAVQRGAEYLDCFDGFLPELYAKHGFVTVKRELNWTIGGPDVVYMQRVF